MSDSDVANCPRCCDLGKVAVTTEMPCPTCRKSVPQAGEASNSSGLLNALRDNHEVLILGKPSKLAGRYEVLFTGPEELMKELFNQF